MDPRDRHWQQVWTSRPPEAFSWFQSAATPSLARIAALRLPADAAIIDVGGGASVLVDHLLERGFANLTVLDIADAALARAQARLGAAAGRVRWLAADLLEWQPDHPFDLWHDRAVMHFLTAPAEQAAYAALLARAVRPGGHAIIATFAPDGPERCSGLPVCRHDGASLSALLGKTFERIEESGERHATPGGSPQSFCWCVFRRRAA